MTTTQEVTDTPTWIRNIRKSLGISQERLAHIIGSSHSAVNRWENGNRSPLPIFEARLRKLKAEADKR